MTSPDPGWYPDPSLDGHLRLWDGERWTDETRAATTATAAAPSPRRGPNRRSLAVGIGVAVAIVVGAAWWASVGHTGTGARASRAAQTAHVAGNPVCPAPARINGAVRVIAWFDREQLGVQSSPAALPSLKDQCSAAAFTVVGLPGLGHVYLLPDAAAAARALAATRSSARPAFVDGPYLVSLDPRAAARQETFRQELVRFVAAHPDPSH